MAKSPLFGRRIHIAGSVPDDLAASPTVEVKQAREVVQGLVKELLRRGATFVVPVDAEKVRPSDGLPICFDWLVWQTLHANLIHRPANAPTPLALAVQHHKNEEQIPKELEHLWDDLRKSDLVQIESAAHWNMASKRMEAQARWGDILITIGGTEGVLFLANLYHDAGKPVVPLNLPICAPDAGARRLFNFGLSSGHSQRLFHASGVGPHGWINRMNFRSQTPISDQVSGIIDLLEALEPPKAFVIRLLNKAHAEYVDVQNYFATVVQPIVEGELGYKLTVVDGRQPYDHPRIDQEIFAKLHRSAVVIADITGMRPNCFLELGYALGRGLPTMLMAKEGSEHPFDIYTLSGLHWTTSETVDERRRLFREHWNAIRSRPPLVPVDPLIS